MKKLSGNKPGAIIIEGHVQGLSNTRSLGEAGISVYVIDRNNCIARYSRYCQNFYYCPDFQSDELVQFLINLAIKETIKNWVLIPSNDHAVYTISKHKTRLREHYKIIAPDMQVLQNIYDKLNLMRLAEKIQIPIPRTAHVKTEHDTIDTQIRYPVLIKGRNGLTFYRNIGKKALISYSEKDLKEKLNLIANKIKIEETYIQELITNRLSTKTVSFTAFCVKGEIMTHWIGEKVRQHPLSFGTATCARSISGKTLIDPSRKLLKELDYTGVCEIEYLYDHKDQAFKLIEINARTWLWVGLAKTCGVDYAKLIYDYVNDNEIIYPNDYQTNITWINYVTDITFSFYALLIRKLKIKDYISSLREKSVNAIFSWKDPIPGLMFLVLSFYIAIKRR
jgi:D-aspartate ligase